MHGQHLGNEVFVVVCVQIMVFWAGTLCGLINSSQDLVEGEGSHVLLKLSYPKTRPALQQRLTIINNQAYI